MPDAHRTHSVLYGGTGTVRLAADFFFQDQSEELRVVDQIAPPCAARFFYKAVQPLKAEVNPFLRRTLYRAGEEIEDCANSA